jgi:hypothetical protein
MPDLSIVIITRDNKKVLGECVSSVIGNTHASTYEIIVVDNDSSDGTPSFIKEKFPSVVLLSNNKNVGFSRANNRGLKAAKGRYSVILNDDTYLKDDAFSSLKDHMDKNPDAGICGPKLLNPDGSLQRQGSLLSALAWRSSQPRRVGMVIGACMFIRMSVISRIGLFDENLFFYNDDMDLCRRANKAGFKVVYFPSARVYHYGGFSAKKQANKFLMVEGYRGGLYYCKKHYGNIAYHLYRILLLLFVLLMLLFSLANREKLKVYLEILGIIIRQQIISKIPSL